MTGAWLTSYVVMWLLLLVLGCLMLGLLRQVGLLNRRFVKTDRAAIAGLEPGSPAPLFEVTALSGQAVSLGSLFDQGRTILLVFASPRCGPCLKMAPVLDVFSQRARVYGWEVILITVGSSRTGAEAYAQETGVHFPVVAQDKAELSMPYKFGGSPFAFVLQAGVVKARKKIDDEQQFEALLQEGGFTSAGDALLPVLAGQGKDLIAGR
ncbi:MAG: TlpA family protein disulfide reductase [Dehalococcoidia bacterium]